MDALDLVNLAEVSKRVEVIGAAGAIYNPNNLEIPATGLGVIVGFQAIKLSKGAGMLTLVSPGDSGAPFGSAVIFGIVQCAEPMGVHLGIQANQMKSTNQVPLYAVDTVGAVLTASALFVQYLFVGF